MTDHQVLENPRFMYLLRAIRDGRVTRGTGRPNPDYWLDGEPVGFEINMLAKQDNLIWKNIGTPPRLGDRGARLVDLAP